MKKIILIFVLLLTVNTNNFENKYFKIVLPDNYIQSKDNNTYKWTNKNNKNDYLLITIAKNNIFNVEDFTDDDINKYKDNLEKSFSEELNINNKIYNIKKEKINGYYALIYNTVYYKNDILDHDIYHKAYLFTYNGYTYLCSFVSDVEEFNDNEIMNSFDIKTIVEINYTYINILVVVGSILAIATAIIRRVIKKKRH